MNNMTPTPDDVELLLPAFGFGLADADESAAVQAALDAGTVNPAALVPYERMAAALLASAPPRTPPPGLRERLLTAAAPSRSAPRQQRLRAWGLAAAAALILLLIGLNLWTLNRLGALQAKNDHLIEQVNDQDALLIALAAGEARAITMQDRRADPGDNPARAVLIFDPAASIGYLQLSDLPPLPDDNSVYQIWLTADGQRQRSSAFTLSGGVVAFESPDAMGVYESIGITLERQPVGDAPTTAPLLRAELRSS